MEAYDKIEQFREQIVEKLLLVATIVTVPSAIFSGIRIFTMGLKPLFIADIAISITLIIAYFLRKKINYKKRILGLILFEFLLGVLAIQTWGLFGLGFLMLFVACVLITALFGLIRGISLFLVSVVIIIIYIVFVTMVGSLGMWISMRYQMIHINGLLVLFFYITFSALVILTLGLLYRNLRSIAKEISDSENQFRSLFENANDAIFILKNDVFIDSNAKTLELFKCTKERIIGQTVGSFSPKFHPMEGFQRKKQ